MTDENSRIIFELSLYFLCKYPGIVKAEYFSVSMRNFSAIKYQEVIIPKVIPRTVHASPRPTDIAAPGKASRSHADSPDALSEKAVTHGPSFLPANK